jgi:hypothetical protein
VTFPSPSQSAVCFDVHGYRFSVTGDCQWAIDGIADDYSAYRSQPAGAAVRLNVSLQPPDYANLPPLRASGYSPRNVSYSSGHTTYLDYGGRALAIHNRETGDFSISSEHPSLLYETCYLYLLSHIGSFLDAKGMHRVHALAISIDGRATLVLLPMGGGKSTLIAELLKYPEVKILSDDSPFIDADANVYPFPLHLGLLPGGESSIPEQHLRQIDRMEFGPKYLVSYDYFAQRVGKMARPGFVFLGHRSLAEECRITPASMPAGIRAMFENCVIGKGLFQGLEFVLQTSLHEKLSLIPTAALRLSASLALLTRSQVRHILLGRCTPTNARTLLQHIRM